MTPLRIALRISTTLNGYGKRRKIEGLLTALILKEKEDKWNSAKRRRRRRKDGCCMVHYG